MQNTQRVTGDVLKTRCLRRFGLSSAKYLHFLIQSKRQQIAACRSFRAFQYFLLVFILVYGELAAQIPLWQWARQIGSPGNEQCFDLATNSSGDVIACGSFDGNLGIIFGVPFITPNQKDGFITSYDAAGNWQWAVRIGGNSDEEVLGIALDPAGNIYVTGYFEGTCDFDPGLFSTANLTSTGGKDGFIARYTASGGLSWVTKFGGAGDDEGNEIAFAGGALHVTGYVNGAALFYSTNSGTTAVAAPGSQQNFVGAKYSSAGVAQWVVSASGPGNEEGLDVTGDASGIYYAGAFTGSAVAYSGAGVPASTLSAASPTSTQAFILACDQSGAISWMRGTPGSGNSQAAGLVQDSLNLYVTGNFNGSAISFPSATGSFSLAGTGQTDHFLAALQKTTGDFTWVSGHTGRGTGAEIVHSLHLSATNHLVLGGAFTAAMNFSAAAGPTLNNSGNEDIFVAEFTTGGMLRWAQSAGGANLDRLLALGSSSTGAVFTGGEHANGISFGVLTFPNMAGRNAFLARTGCENIGNNIVSGSQTICAGAGAAALTGLVPSVSGTLAYSWQQSSDGLNWSSAGGSGAAQNYTPGTLNSTRYYRRMVQATGTCTFASNVVTVSVSQPPSPAQAGSDQTVCAPGTTLQAGPLTVGAGIWTSLSSASLSVINTSLATVSNLSAGANVFVYTSTSGVCPPDHDTVVVFRDLPPAPVLAGPSQTVCSSSATLSAVSPTAGTGTWSSTGSAIIQASANAVTPVASLSVGITIFQWTVINGVCPASSASVTVIRDAVPSAAVVAPPQTVCATQATISATPPATGSGSWSAITASASVTAPLSNSTQVGSLQPGVNSFEWKVQNGVCPASSATATVLRLTAPGPATAGSSQTLCVSGTTIAAATPTTGSGNWSVLTGSGSILAPGNPTTAVTGMGTGINAFLWTVTNGICPAATATLLVQRDAPPSQAIAGSSQTVCSASSSLNAQPPAVGSGSWSVSGGLATITNPASASSGVSGLQEGSNIFQWTVFNGVCPASTATTLIRRDAMPDQAIAGSNQTLCGSTATVTANQPTIGAGTWTVLSGSGVITSQSPTTQIQSLTTGSNKVSWIIQNGACPPSSDTLEIFSYSPPGAASAMQDFTTCASSSTLTAAAPLNGSGTWSLAAGNATIGSPTSSTTHINLLSAGTHTFVWTVTNGVCAPLSDTVLVTRLAPPGPALAGPDQSVCATTATLSAITPTAGTGAWSLISGSATIVSPGNPLTAITSLTTGASVFNWVVTNGICSPVNSTVMVHRDDFPGPAVVVPDYTVCANEATLSATAPATGQGVWLPINTTASVQAPAVNQTSVTGLQPGNNAFSWNVTNGVCAPATATLHIFRDLPPGPVSAGIDKAVCDSVTGIAATQPTTGAGQWSSTLATFLNPGNPVTTVTGLQAGINVLVWTVSSGVCAPFSDTLVISRDLPPGLPFAGTDQTVCAPGTTLAAQNPSPGSGVWSAPGSAAFADSTLNTTAVTNLGAGPNHLVWKTFNGTCPTREDTVTVTRVLPESPASAGDDQRVCAESATLGAQQTAQALTYWTIVAGSAQISSTLAANAVLSNLSPGIIRLAWITSKPFCPLVSDTVEILRDREPGQPQINAPQAVCGTSVELAGNLPLEGTGSWAITSGTAILQVQSSNVLVTEMQQGTLIISYTFSNGVCPLMRAENQVVVFHEPSVAQAGDDQVVCSSQSTLTAVSPAKGSGHWSLSNGTGTIGFPDSSITPVYTLGKGENVFLWTVRNGICAEKTDMVRVTQDTVSEPVDAGSDIETESESVRLNAVADGRGTGHWELVHGTAVLSDPQDPQAVAFQLAGGKNVFRWVVTKGDCPAQSDEVVVHVREFMVPNGISPNGDGKNDVFYINTLQRYDMVKLIVYNRWGNQVFESNDYRNDWDGTNSKGEMLAEDTYYYLLQIPGKDELTGFITIKRQ